jgi:hypothetical protein
MSGLRDCWAYADPKVKNSKNKIIRFKIVLLCKKRNMKLKKRDYWGGALSLSKEICREEYKTASVISRRATKRKTTKVSPDLETATALLIKEQARQS